MEAMVMVKYGMMRMKDEKDENLLMGDRFSRPCVNIELVFL